MFLAVDHPVDGKNCFLILLNIQSSIGVGFASLAVIPDVPYFLL